MPLETLQFEDFELDRSACELRRDGNVVHLERIPFDLLNLLVERHGELVTRQEILEQIWGKNVYVDADNSINTAIRKIRQALHDNPEAPRFVVTVPARGYRFVAPLEKQPLPAEIPAAGTNGAGREAPAATIAPSLVLNATKRRKAVAAVATALAIAALAVAALLLRFHRAPALSAKDTIVIADFANSTGDAVFDETLKQALSVQLEQSPFLSILSGKKMTETLQMMGRPAGERVSEKIALEVCQRTLSAAVLAGTIAKLGNEYVIGLNAVDCQREKVLAAEQARVSSKEQVLRALDGEAKHLRGRLGESLASIERFDTPIEEATTASLEALQAYSLGCRKLMNGDNIAAVAFFQRAISLDPEFAMAYARLGATDSNLWELNLATENTKRAYELRRKVSERERFYIDSHYHMFVTGSVEKGRQTFELWAQAYPRDVTPIFNLGELHSNIGQYDKALEEARESLRLEPDSGLNYATLAYRYLMLDRVSDAQTVIEEAEAKNLDSTALHLDLYQLAFLQNDEAELAKQVAWGAHKPGVEDKFFAFAAASAAYFGRLSDSRELSRRAVFSAEQAEEKETAIGYEVNEMVREALLGNFLEARAQPPTVRGHLMSEDMQFAWGFASAIIGDAARGQAIADDLAKRFPEDTFVQFVYVPMIRAQLWIAGHDPAKAVEVLQSATPYEMGDLPFVKLYPAYVRGEAYLAERDGTHAAIAFQKIVDHREVTGNEIIGALAHLQLGRAYVLRGDAVKARAAYLQFLALWKDADPEIPILKEAKAEYAKLQ
ncbi:MAG: winged helix-turn-helix domain-containing protein [Candidatus Acidiferrales bacterium]